MCTHMRDADCFILQLGHKLKTLTWLEEKVLYFETLSTFIICTNKRNLATILGNVIWLCLQNEKEKKKLLEVE